VTSLGTWLLRVRGKHRSQDPRGRTLEAEARRHPALSQRRRGTWKRMQEASHPRRDPSIQAPRYSAQWCGRPNSRAMDLGTVRSMIDRDSHVPPWMQLAEILRERIRNGEITNRLPGERSLQQEFGLAPVTIRKAVRKLADEGIVRTTPGMGSFVVKPSPSPDSGFGA
jgi:GntR family transcriptional regulator